MLRRPTVAKRVNSHIYRTDERTDKLIFTCDLRLKISNLQALFFSLEYQPESFRNHETSPGILQWKLQVKTKAVFLANLALVFLALVFYKEK